MVSAADELSGAIRCIERGAQAHLTDHLNPQLLEARVRATLERGHQRDLLAARRLLQLSMVPPTGRSRARTAGCAWRPA